MLWLQHVNFYVIPSTWGKIYSKHHFIFKGKNLRLSFTDSQKVSKCKENLQVSEP